MKVELRCSEDMSSMALEIIDIPRYQIESIEDMMRDILSFSEKYLECLELRLDFSARKDKDKLSSLLAQILKSRAFLEEAKQHLILGVSAAKGEVSASELGFPEFNDR